MRLEIRWDFKLGDGHRFTEPRYSELLETSRKLVELIRERSLLTEMEQRATTTCGYFIMLRLLLRWMLARRIGRFSSLSSLDVRSYRRYLSERSGAKGRRMSPHTLAKHLYLLAYLHRYSDELGDGIREDPLDGQSVGAASGAFTSAIKPIPYTPQELAVKLVSEAISRVENSAGTVLEARAVYVAASAKAHARKVCRALVDMEAGAAVDELGTIPRGPKGGSLTALRYAIDDLYAACFICLSYLIGARASEILYLEYGCGRPPRDELPGRIVGAIYKKQPGFMGREHEWIAPPAALKAIEVLERLSSPHRANADDGFLWLRRTGNTGVREWSPHESGGLAVISRQKINDLLQRFANGVGLTDRNGKQWRMSTHQGRKTFARFVALRDRTALLALAQQLGHRERGVTDRAYSGYDYRLHEEIDEEIVEQSVGAWEEMIASPRLAGKAGIEIAAKRPRFKGSRAKEDIATYAALLVEAGLVLGVCDWGYCVYRQRSSACGGGAGGPNPVRRTPSVCATCNNFAVGPRHAAYWTFQRARHLKLAQEPLLPWQTRALAQERVSEAERILDDLQAVAGGEIKGCPSR
jgi:integrase